jgi:hypothetical protein
MQPTRRGWTRTNQPEVNNAEIPYRVRVEVVGLRLGRELLGHLLLELGLVLSAASLLQSHQSSKVNQA